MNRSYQVIKRSSSLCQAKGLGKKGKTPNPSPIQRVRSKDLPNCVDIARHRTSRFVTLIHAPDLCPTTIERLLAADWLVLAVPPSGWHRRAAWLGCAHWWSDPRPPTSVEIACSGPVTTPSTAAPRLIFQAFNWCQSWLSYPRWGCKGSTGCPARLWCRKEIERSV